MDKESASEFGLKPGGLGRHKQPGVCHCKQLLHRSRIHGKCSAVTRPVYCLCKYIKPPYTAYKADPAVCFGIADIQQRTKDYILQDGYIQPVHGIFRKKMRICRQPVPAAVSIKSDLALTGRATDLVPHIGNVKTASEQIQKIVKCITIQIRHHPVIIVDVQLFCRKQDGKEVIEFLLTAEAGMFLAALQSGLYGGCSTVMAVCLPARWAPRKAVAPASASWPAPASDSQPSCFLFIRIW